MEDGSQASTIPHQGEAQAATEKKQPWTTASFASSLFFGTMLKTRQSLLRNVLRSNKAISLGRSYHSFPSPDEKPVITNSTANYKKTYDKKNVPGFSVDEKFRLEKQFPGVVTSSGISSSERPKTLSTTLKNGLTVSSQDTLGLMTTFSFLIQVGSAFEVQEGPDSNAGATQMLELAAFRSTESRSRQQITQEIEELGGMVQCIASRDGLYYCVDVLRENVGAALDILADTVLNPSFSEEEIEDCKDIIVLQQNELPSEIFSRDAVQIAAYKGSSMGNTHFCPEEKVGNIDRDLVVRYREKYLFGENCFVSAAGYEHEAFVKLVESKFKSIKNGVRSTIPKSVFVGGMFCNERALKEPFIKIALAFEVGGWKDPMLVSICVLQQLLGGGSSFSAGGPGKGMYTRLYRDVLGQHHWVESAEAFMCINDDSGIMGIDGSCPPEYASNLIRIIVSELTKLAFVPVSDIELSRAKNMLKSMMMMQLESRLVTCEDIARQFSTYGLRQTPESVCQQIDIVTKEDLIAVAKRMLLTPPAVGCIGHDLSKLPTYDQINDFTTNCRSEISKRV